MLGDHLVLETLAAAAAPATETGLDKPTLVVNTFVQHPAYTPLGAGFVMPLAPPPAPPAALVRTTQPGLVPHWQLVLLSAALAGHTNSARPTLG